MCCMLIINVALMEPAMYFLWQSCRKYQFILIKKVKPILFKKNKIKKMLIHIHQTTVQNYSNQ